MISLACSPMQCPQRSPRLFTARRHRQLKSKPGWSHSATATVTACREFLMGKQRQQIINKLKLKLKKSQCLCRKNGDCLGFHFVLVRQRYIFSVHICNDFILISLFSCFVVSCFSNTRAEPDQTRRAREKQIENWRPLLEKLHKNN